MDGGVGGWTRYLHRSLVFPHCLVHVLQGGQAAASSVAAWACCTSGAIGCVENLGKILCCSSA